MGTVSSWEDSSGKTKSVERNLKGILAGRLNILCKGLTLSGDLLEGSFEVHLNFPGVAIEYQWDGPVEFMGEISQGKCRFPARPEADL